MHLLVAALVVADAVAAAAKADAVPATWMKRWAKPAPSDRPLQIIHGIEPAGSMAQSMAAHRDRGLGGVVCNVSFTDYLRSEEKWRAFLEGVAACRNLGMVVWIYDERGYPSGAAGGLVLKDHPEYEAQELAYDAALPDPFVIRPAYEHTHASNNFAASQRYINLIDDRAVRAFIATTHQAYRDRIGAGFANSVHAFFTDEPSLITVNLGQIPEAARKNVPVVDPVDPNAKMLPAVPWVYDLPDRYRERYGEDLLAARRSLFSGDSGADRRTRRQFWALIGDLIAERYFGEIEKWCAGAGVASSGHTLWEESIIHHPTLEGDALKVLGRMDIPGLDLLTSNPEAVLNDTWSTAALPSSAAMLTGRRCVMTEVSDFAQTMAGDAPATLAAMQATAAWQAALGVTEFTLYYNPADRSTEDYHAYGDYVGRLNAILKPARLDPDVLLYYPVYDLWSEYRPVAEPLNLHSQSPHAQRIVDSFNALGRSLTRGQVPFALIDHEFLACAMVRRDGVLAIKGHAFRTLVLPDGVELPEAAARTVERFRKQGGTVLQNAVPPSPHELTPASDRIVLGRFTRDGRPVLLVVNVGPARWDGTLRVHGGAWTKLDPATGHAEAVAADGAGRVTLALGAEEAVLLVGGE